MQTKVKRDIYKALGILLIIVVVLVILGLLF